MGKGKNKKGAAGGGTSDSEEKASASERLISTPVAGSAEDESQTQTFVPSRGLSTFEANELLLKYGRNELEDVSTPKVRPPP